MNKIDKLLTIKNKVEICTNCPLHENRNNIVFGDGNENSKVILVGEAPGANEDLQGIPFVGRSGKLLTELLFEIGLSREKNLYITNTVKCRPVNNANPKTAETKACRHFLEEQIEVITPKVIILAGNFPIKYFFPKSAGVGTVHGEFIEQNGINFFPIYHPAALLRNRNLIPTAKADFEKLKSYLLKENII